MRVNFRLKFGNLTFFSMLSHTQRMTGITSKLSKTKDQHVILIDLESYALQRKKNPRSMDRMNYSNVRYELQQVQRQFGLSHMFVVSDKPLLSWRVYCWTVVDFRTYLKILLSLHSCDWNFIYWTMVRGESTLRITQKEGRPDQFLYDVIESYHVEIPKEFPAKMVNYETGIEKKGIVVKLGK